MLCRVAEQADSDLDLSDAVDVNDPPTDAEVFEGEIRVASRIVDFLSSGLYETPAACLKELINNSYDADAKRVEVLVKPEADQIVISDDGIGLTRDEFVNHFERVSESHKRDERSTTPSGRPLVGRIGIGLIAANELCDAMEITSTKKGEPERLRVTINFDAMREDPSGGGRREEEADGAVFKKGDFEGWIEEVPKSHHYTRIFLRKISESARRIFVGAPRGVITGGRDSLYGLTPESIVEKLERPGLRSWSEFDEYSKTMLEVGLNVPVRYAPKWIPRDVKSRVADLEKEVEEADFTLLYDGTDVRKPTVLRADEGHFLRRFSFEGESVSARGYFFAKRRVLLPQELNGLLIRIRRAAVADYDRGWMDFSATENRLFQDWISAEIWADDRLEEALNIDRRTLRITHPAYVELQKEVHKELSSVLKEARERFYTKRSQARRTTEAKEQIDRVHEIASDHGVRLPTVAKRRPQLPAAAPEEKRAIRRATAKMSVSQVYELALEVANEELPPQQYQRFAKALADRLLS
jgi:hypothetical protein